MAADKRVELAKRFQEEANALGYDMKLELTIRGQFDNVVVRKSLFYRCIYTVEFKS